MIRKLWLGLIITLCAIGGVFLIAAESLAELGDWIERGID
jgi:hypothetical protein